MSTLLNGVAVGRKNVLIGMVLFVVLGIGMGIPLTIDFFGGTVLTPDQYQIWKVIHGYGIFLAFINYFFGFLVDRLALTRPQKEVASWSFFVAAVFGAFGRVGLVLASALPAFGLYASLGEAACFTLGTVVVVIGQTRSRIAVPTSQQPADRGRLAA